ncbi:MAG TPA: GNAT family N-acetyltransferase [Iamia sp.]
MAERVLWLVKGLGRGGTERIITLAARHADPERFAVEVAYVQPWKDAVVADVEAAGVPVHLLGSGGSTRGWTLRLQRLLAQRRYALVHTHSPLPAAVARALPGGRRAAFVHTEHSAWSRYVAPTRVANRATFGRNRHVFAVSEGVARSIARPGWVRGVRMPPVEVLYHGIDEAEVRRGPAARHAGRATLGLPDDAVVVGTVGNLAPKKDHHSLIEAFAGLAAGWPAAHLVIVGGGPLEDELRDRARTTGLAGRVHLLGQRPDVAELLPAFDVFALSSRHEGLGLAVVEAMASGVPVVATEVDGVPEVVTHDVDGVLVPPGRPDRLATAIADLLGDPERAGRLAAAGVASSARFSIPAAVTRIEQVYDEVLGGGAPVGSAPARPSAPSAPSGPSGPPVSIRPATAADEPAILDLLQTSLGGGPLGARTSDFFAWKHHANPFGPSYAFVAEVDGEVVGFRTFMRWRWRAGPRTYEAVRAVDTATHPDHQGRGIFTRLTLGAVDAIEGDVDLVFNTPNASSRPGYLKMGWDMVGTVPIAVRPVRPLRFARGVRAARADVVAPAIDCPLPPAAEVLAGPGLGDLVAQVAGGAGRLATDRSLDYLRWRYDAPGLDYRAVALHAGGDLVAVAVGRPRARGPLAELTLSEVLVRAGDRAAARRVLGEVVRGSGCDHVAAVIGLDPALAGAFRSQGFLPLPGQGMVLTTRPLRPVAPDPRLLSSWAFALGDLEVF